MFPDWRLVDGSDYPDSRDEAAEKAPARFDRNLSALRRAIKFDPLHHLSEPLFSDDDALRLRHTDDEANGYSLFICYRIYRDRWEVELQWAEVTPIGG